MRRHGKAGGKAEKTPVSDRASRKRSRGPEAKPSRVRSNGALHQKLDRQARELSEAQERQTATAEVLRIISASPGDLKPVFDAILRNATRLCQAKFGTLYLIEAGICRVVAMHNAPTSLAEFRRRDPVVNITGNSLIGRVARVKRTIQSTDLAATPAARNDPQEQRFAKLSGARSVITVPMLKDNELIGLVTVFRQEVRPFPSRKSSC